MYVQRLSKTINAAAAARAGLKMFKRFNIKYIRMILKKLIKKINKENAPPGGWKKTDKLSSSQAFKHSNTRRKSTS